MQREHRGEEEHLLTRGEALSCCNDIEVLPCPAGLQPLGLHVENQAVSGMFCKPSNRCANMGEAMPMVKANLICIAPKCIMVGKPSARTGPVIGTCPGLYTPQGYYGSLGEQERCPIPIRW